MRNLDYHGQTGKSTRVQRSTARNTSDKRKFLDLEAKSTALFLL